MDQIRPPGLSSAISRAAKTGLLIGCNLAAGVTALFLLIGHVEASTPAFTAVRTGWQTSEARLLDRQGTLLQEIRLDRLARRTEWTELDRVSPAMQAAVILAEDGRFLHHTGVDWLAAAKAALTNWLSQRNRGASTLSMQVAAMLEAKPGKRQGRRNIAEKWHQMQAAEALEMRWSKPQILESYLNLTSFRGDLIGIDAAARALFDKRPAGLSSAESLILAALIRAPGAKPDQVAKRACALAERLPNGPDCGELTRLARNSLTGRHPIVPTANLAPHLARRILKQPGQKLRSSLDARLQSTVIDILGEQLHRLANHHVADTAALVVDNPSGEVLAYVSLSDQNSTSPESDGVQASRQAGSTLKPFLYAIALERRYLTAASPLEDSQMSLATPGGSYAPENYDQQYRGLASVRVALASSLNVPAVRVLDLIGADLFAEQLHRLGFKGMTETADFYGPALALGSLDVSLWELVSAYRTLANRGRRAEDLSLTTAHPNATRSQSVINPDVAWIIADILSDRGARAATFGLENALATPWWSAVKTGTSKDMRDNWCIGFSDLFTVGVWVGNFSGEPMHDVSGIAGAAPAWRLIMERLHANSPARQPKTPTRLQLQAISPPGEARRLEWFLHGTAPASPVWTAHQPADRIIVPADGDIYAYDPDIPTPHQRLRPVASGAPNAHHWRLDGVPLPRADWTLTRGQHRLQLLSNTLQPLDQVEFEVR